CSSDLVPARWRSWRSPRGSPLANPTATRGRCERCRSCACGRGRLPWRPRSRSSWRRSSSYCNRSLQRDEVRRHRDAATAVDGAGDSAQDVHYVRGLFARHLLRPTFEYRTDQVPYAGAPPHLGAREVREPLVGLPELSHLDTALRVLPAGEVQRSQVAVQLDARLLALLGYVEVGGEPHQHAALQLDGCRDEVGRSEGEGCAALGGAVGFE